MIALQLRRLGRTPVASDALMTLPPSKIWRAPMKALAPHWGALLALALFMAAGLAVLDDYGVTADEPNHARLAAMVWAFIAAGNEDAFYGADDYVLFYGPSFDLARLFAERSLGIEGGRSVYLAQHLLIHLAFLTGGLFTYLLAYRLFGNKVIALFATLFFLLHPRLYAHSFFNSKDIPFLILFAVALFLAHRAFKRETIAAFVLLGVGVAVAVNLRIMGVVLLAAIPALRALDFAFAQGWAERKRILVTAGAFVLAAGLAFFALLPYLWADPVGRAVEWWTTLSNDPSVSVVPQLLDRIVEFRGYLPLWFSITSPPFTLLLGPVGGAVVLFRAVKAPRRALGNTRLRFGLLLAGCFALSSLAVAALNPGFYFDWRHLYFLWAPFALLAALGLGGLVAALSARRLRAAAYGAAGAGLGATVISMALIHPNQQAFFNFSVDRASPEYLRSQYVMEYWLHPIRQALEWLSDNPHALPNAPIVTSQLDHELISENLAILPDAARSRLAGKLSSFHMPLYRQRSWARSARALHRVEVYDNTMLTIERKDNLQEVYETTLGREPTSPRAFDIHHLDGAVALVMEPCAPAFIENVNATLRVTPVDPGDLPPWREGKREETRNFFLTQHGEFFDGKCVASLPLPDYPIADFRLVVWGHELLGRESARETMRRAKDEGRLLARSAYDIHLADGELVYVNEGCDPMETEHAFYMDVVPERAADLPEDLRRRGYERFGFDFYRHGAFVGEACVATFTLPDYPVDSVRTGQSAPEGGDAWRAEFSVNAEPYRNAYLSAVRREPLARGAFDVYLADGALVYAKERCDWNDTEARFFLHVIPDRVKDLPEDRREHGFDNLDFRFFGRGGYFDGKCAAVVPLPPYPIASIRTGQFGSAGEIWSADFAVGR